jgi:acetoin utilization deacetylase AcuC-like enzyme
MKNSPSAHTRHSETRRGLRVYFSDAYCAAAEQGETIQKAQWIVESLRKRPIPGVELVAPEPLTADQMMKVHEPAYVEALRTGEPRSLAESSGLTWDAGLWTSVSASNGGVVGAALHAMTTRHNAGSLSAGIHHARAGTGVAFCAINGLALAARAVIDAAAKRVLIIDVDAHCGGGTYSIVRGWPEVTQLDLAVSGFDRYEPEPGSGSTLDLIEDVAAYVPTLRRRLADLDAGAFSVVLYGAGMDAHEGNSGLRGLDYALLAERETEVFRWSAGRVPVSFVCLGGYLSTTLEREDVARLHRLTIAAASLANAGGDLSTHAVMETASTQEGSEGFSWDAAGRKSDAGFFDDLGDEEDDPFAYDLDEFLALSPKEQEAFLQNRDEGGSAQPAAYSSRPTRIRGHMKFS